jgi:hypothetical protein
MINISIINVFSFAFSAIKRITILLFLNTLPLTFIQMKNYTRSFLFLKTLLFIFMKVYKISFVLEDINYFSLLWKSEIHQVFNRVNMLWITILMHIYFSSTKIWANSNVTQLYFFDIFHAYWIKYISSKLTQINITIIGQIYYLIGGIQLAYIHNTFASFV